MIQNDFEFTDEEKFNIESSAQILEDFFEYSEEDAIEFIAKSYIEYVHYFEDDPQICRDDCAANFSHRGPLYMAGYFHFFDKVESKNSNSDFNQWYIEQYSRIFEG